MCYTTWAEANHVSIGRFQSKQCPWNKGLKTVCLAIYRMCPVDCSIFIQLSIIIVPTMNAFPDDVETAMTSSTYQSDVAAVMLSIT